MIDESTRHHLLLVALAQRSLSIGLAILAALFVLGVVAIGIGGQSAEVPVKGMVVFAMLYLTAATYHLSRTMGDARGLRITLACATLLVPFAFLITPPVLLGRARRMLRAHAVDAGLFTVGRTELQWLRAESGTPVPCLGCGYDLTGIAEHALCPECGRPRD